MANGVDSATASPSVPRPRRWQARLPGRPAERAPAHVVLRRVNAVAVLLVAVEALAAVVASARLGLDAGWTAVVVAALLGVRAGRRLYRRRLWLSWFQDLPRSAAATATAFALVTVIALVAPSAEATSAQWAVLAFAALSEPARLAVFAFGRWCRRKLRRCDRAIVVGAGKVGVDLVRAMQAHPEFGLLPVGFVDPEPVRDPASLPVRLLDGELADEIVRLGVGTVVLAFSHARDSPVVESAITAHRLRCTALVVPRMYELYQDGPDVERLRSYPLMRLGTAPTARPSWWLKRVFDLVLAACALVALAPVLALCALAVLLESGRPVIFRQVRVGMDDRTFVLYKLRSVRMSGEDDSQVRWSVVGDRRVGPVGRFLRRTSLDELPQLWNVLRGDMSIVGPRPERPGFVRQFSAIHELYWARHRVPTGLTGLAQVHGLRGDTSIVDRSRYDNYYIANWSLWLDVKILLLTVGELVCRRNR
ncbi:exopolysaccharide biosynthesis polyprenyl glycosylphosphotransferase [Saccharothrix coeruleofusca]|uniref:UDP-phosphate galactose phosphotransferase n=1 Tax=Saccharothrix coeruleofusca TaxID=33919 RepID=A0A918AVS3_9PSEU|nr:exopolysaccharide biosynthesis polyprenyl glycosylphosphotransferase [Saccharothrix coeruleofusca]MBP2335406.1 exopolysaccharide biosynthesis polyprenyl glycosylphosphotransferase [Saccharothrix coeruleofusca]GGP77635.1 UDP-phosphate galactose phosphotransferase [Saccharothrix coeruleofusca]